MTPNVRFFTRRALMAHHPLLVRHRHLSKHIFLRSSDPAPLFSSWLPFVTLKRHCSGSRRWIRECWSSLTRGMGDVGHVHAGGMPFIWNSILHLTTDLHLRAKRAAKNYPGSGDKREKAGTAYISTAFSTSTPHSILFQVFLVQHFQDCDILNGPYTTTTIDTPVRNANLPLTFFLSQCELLLHFKAQ